ncbi:hypothetical protein TWF730_004201 [Orbilia blumenaviensis]|uniref:ZZ-type domain-containing protein n=1 Tax=Orbilia blumenaviensis TaxID=1796055 RepID=A0AAV9U020_9PEZI
MATPVPQIPQAGPAHVPVNPDTLITVKVSYNGGIRRFKLPLRDLGPAVLPTKLRVALAISSDQQVCFERYSDSAASFVVLDTDNLTVYKQLYRAAKAKLKLRLKATIITPETVAEPIASNPPAYTSQVTLASVESVPTPAPVVPEPVVENVAPEVTRAPLEPQPEPVDYTQTIVDQVTSYLAGDVFAQQLQQNVEAEVDRRMKELSLKNVVPEPVKTECKLGACMEGEVPPPQVRSFLVYCNKCQGTISGEHYHCSICDQGDYDLCAICVDNGVHCEGDHWLIKRTLEKGRIVSSTTEYNKRKQRSKVPSPPVPEQAPPPPPFRTRTCNCCIASLPEECFVTCNVCEDYDICLPCHIAQKHGHHPMHGFTPATKDTPLDPVGTALLEPGRGVRHNAICDGCDTTINGVRHKCLGCPDWDYCSACALTASETHPGHKFVRIYEAINISPLYTPKAIHNGVRCDGPLCRTNMMYIMGDRYKCAICDDLDFCANCEASPLNDHNSTHPLIKMKTAIQGITCATTETTPNGPTSLLGDVRSFDSAVLRSTTNAATQVQTVADVEPSTEFLDEKKAPVEHSEPIPVPVKEAEPLQAEYLRDVIADGTSFTSGTNFEQVWTLTNTGTSAWPAGVTVRFVGGDHMFRHGSEESCIATVTNTSVNPGETASFAVDLSAPFTSNRRVISYWRLTAPNGSRFGHKLWCDIEIMEEKKQLIDLSETIKYDDKLDEKVEDSDSSASSQMIFPKLEKESQILAVEEAIPTEVETETEAETETTLLGAQNPAASPAWTLTLSEEEGHTSDGVTSEDDVDSLMLDDEDYEVLETSDDDGLYV